MTYPRSRSMNVDLQKGVDDGTEYDDTPNRGGDYPSRPTAPEFRRTHCDQKFVNTY